MTLLRTLLALVVVLVVPGYLLLLALFPHRGPRDAERVMLVIGVSLAISVIADLILQLTSQGITGAGVDWVLGLISLVLAVCAAVRAWLSRRGFSSRSSEGLADFASSMLHAAILGAPVLLAGGLIVAAIAITRSDAIRVAKRSSFTQLWLLPRKGGAELGVSSFEHDAKRFTITVTAGHRPISSRTIRLKPDTTYSQKIALSPRQAAKMRIQARLFIGGNVVPYRMVSWTPGAAER